MPQDNGEGEYTITYEFTATRVSLETWGRLGPHAVPWTRYEVDIACGVNGALKDLNECWQTEIRIRLQTCNLTTLPGLEDPAANVARWIRDQLIAQGLPIGWVRTYRLLET